MSKVNNFFFDKSDGKPFAAALHHSNKLDMDFDETRLYYSHQQLQVQQQSGDAEESQDGDAIRPRRIR